MLNNINHIKINPHTRAQAILGTNGSGKSSLLKELTPLPANSSDYGKDGSKIISITSHGHDYLLISDFSKANPHSFLKNMEELNKGGTITVQKELVRQEFGIRQEIHDLMTGLEKFTLMSPSRRREWFTELCETNYDYPLSVYGKFKERSRDTSGALKLAKKRLVVETTKLPHSKDIENIQLQIDDVVREITLLYENKVDETRTPLTIEKQQNIWISELQLITTRLFSVKGHFNKRQVFTEEELLYDLDQKKHEITQVNTKIEMLSKEHLKLKTALDEFEKTGQDSVIELKDKREGLVKQREELWGRRKLSLEPVEAVGALSALETMQEYLFSILVNMPENKERKLSSVNLNILQEKVFDLKTKLQSSEQRLLKLNHDKEHLEQLKAGGDIECPKCNHRWVIGYTQTNYDKLISVINQGTLFIVEQKNILAQLESDLKINVEYNNNYSEFARCVRSTPILKPFWDYLLEGEHIYKSPNNVMRLLELYKIDLDFEIQYKVITDEVTKIDQLIQIALKATSVDAGNVKTRIDSIETELGLLNREKYLTNNQLVDRTQDYQKVVEIGKLSEQIKQYQTQLEKGFNDSIRAVRNEVINSCLNQLQIDLAQKQSKLNDIRMQKGIVDDIEKNIEVLTQDDIALKLVIDTLSPTDGLIAEGLLGFIRNFIRKMNRLISKVWLYRMEVQDCSVSTEEGAELDYRFPVLVQTKDNIIPDVGKCSMGMQEIMNLAFRIVAMRYLGLSDYPIYLDELGSALDTEHKSQIVILIKYLIEQCSFSQIYLVSHDLLQYGAIGNIDTCVLCPANILIPGKYNEHVEMS